MAKTDDGSTDQAAEPGLEIDDPRLRSLYLYWKGKAGARRMPARRDLDPMEMKPWLGNLTLVEFPTDDARDCRYRLEGTNIEAFHGVRRTGRGLDALTPEEKRSAVLRQWQAVLGDGRPAYHESDLRSSEGEPAHQSTLLLPLSDDGERVNMILAGIYFRPCTRLEADELPRRRQ